MMRSDQEDDEYEDGYESSEEDPDETDSEDEESDEESEEEGFLGARYAAVDQIMRGQATGSSTDRAGERLARSVTWPGQVFKRSALRRSSEPYQRKSVSFAEELVETKEFVAFQGSPASSDSSPVATAEPYRNMPVEMDPEALEGAAFSRFRNLMTPTEMESPQEGLPGKAVPAMAPLSKVSHAFEEAAGADGVGSLQESSTFSTTAAEVDVQSHCAEDEDAALPEHEPADEASVLNVLEAKEDEKEEKKDEEKDEDEELTASLVAGASVASDAEQPEGEPSSLDQAYGTEDEELAASLVAGAFVASDAEQPEGEPVDGSGSDGEDLLETLDHVPPKPESDLQASAGIAGFPSTLGTFDMEAAGRADCAIHGTPGQHSDSDVQTDDSLAVQQPTVEEAVKKMSSKEQMAAKMEERRRKLEGLLPQEPREAEPLEKPGEEPPPAQDGFSKLLQEWLEGADAFLATLGCCGRRQSVEMSAAWLRATQ